MAETTPKTPVKIDVFSDVVCPWCFVGKRRIEEASRATGIPVELRFRAFQLTPEVPPEGLPHRQHLESKLGGPQRVAKAWEMLSALGKEDGIAFDMEKIKFSPNTKYAHAAIKAAQAQGLGVQAKEALLSGHFEKGVNLVDHEAIWKVLGAIPGLDLVKARAYAETGPAVAEVDADLAEARRLRVNGVPFFLSASGHAVRGADDVDGFSEFLKQAQAKQPA
jgi:predicted DsbA family dithiol-disulfide isomerase